MLECKGEGCFSCKECNTEYDRLYIESLLVDQVQRGLTAYQLQDLECVKCRQVKADSVSLRCDQCTGKFRCKLPRDQLQEKLLFLLVSLCFRD